MRPLAVVYVREAFKVSAQSDMEEVEAEHDALLAVIKPFACLADLLPEAIRPEETVTLEIKAGDLIMARKAYLEGM